MRTVTTNPIQYKGKLVSFVLKYDLRDRVNSWDILYQGTVLNKSDALLRQSLGFTNEDMAVLNAYVEQMIAAQEGTILGDANYT